LPVSVILCLSPAADAVHISAEHTNSASSFWICLFVRHPFVCMSYMASINYTVRGSLCEIILQ